jgi:hypothetical protein
VQHLVDDDEVEAAAGEGRGVDVALAQLDPQARLLEVGAGDGQHGMARIEADGAARPRPEELQHAAGAGAEVEEAADRLRADGVEDRGLDLVLGGVERAQPVPVRRQALEEGPRRDRAARPHLGEAGAVAGEPVVAAVEGGEDGAQDLGRGGALAEAEEGPGAFAVPLDEAGLGQELEMT